MTVKSSISLTDEQDAFVRTLVAQGRYATASAVVQQGLELLRSKTEADAVETEALKHLLAERRRGEFVSATDMQRRVEEIAKRRRVDGV